MARARFCTACGHEGKPRKRNPGYIVVDLLLWGCGLVLLWPVLIVAVVHSLWRLAAAYDACRECGSKQLVPVDSPVALQFKQKAPSP